VRIGIISDTHNYLDPKVLKAFEGVGHILHAGDIGLPRLISELEAIAPVSAVSGNTDDPGLKYADTRLIELGRHRFLLHHIINPHAPAAPIQDRILHERPEVVVFGHTHKPFCERINGILFFNPGYAGKSRFGMERTVAILHCDGNGIRPELIRLGLVNSATGESNNLMSRPTQTP
jgi:putative phosphoesterase